MIINIDHIAIAVSDLEEALGFWRDTLGLKVTHREEVSSQQVDTAFFEIGASKIELVEPTTEDSGIARFVKKQGPSTEYDAGLGRPGIRDDDSGGPRDRRSSRSGRPKTGRLRHWLVSHKLEY